MNLKKFLSNNVGRIVIRTLERKDTKRVRDFVDYINSIVSEKDYIGLAKKVTLKEEKEWLKNVLKGQAKRKEFFIVAEHDRRIVGAAGINSKIGKMDHVTELGISIRKDHRGIGIGKELMDSIIRISRKLERKPKIIRLTVMETNKRAIALYKRFGFRKVAVVPKQIQRKGTLISEVIMLKYL